MLSCGWTNVTDRKVNRPNVFCVSFESYSITSIYLTFFLKWNIFHRMRSFYRPSRGHCDIWNSSTGQSGIYLENCNMNMSVALNAYSHLIQLTANLRLLLNEHVPLVQSIGRRRTSHQYSVHHNYIWIYSIIIIHICMHPLWFIKWSKRNSFELKIILNVSLCKYVCI